MVEIKPLTVLYREHLPPTPYVANRIAFYLNFGGELQQLLRGGLSTEITVMDADALRCDWRWRGRNLGCLYDARGPGGRVTISLLAAGMRTLARDIAEKDLFDKIFRPALLEIHGTLTHRKDTSASTLRTIGRRIVNHGK